jgi:hypothetical protein
MSQCIPKAYLITQGAHKPSLIASSIQNFTWESPGKHQLKVDQYLFEQANESMKSTEGVIKYVIPSRITHESYLRG